MIERKMRTMPNPNGTEATTLAAHGTEGEFVQANQNNPMGRTIPPTMPIGNLASGAA